jgi:SAM-dependent methyltransferase
MLTDRLKSACPPQLLGPLARYLTGEISAEIALMQFALRSDGAESLKSILEGLVAAAPQRQELADVVRLAEANADNLGQLTALSKEGLVRIPCAAGDRVAAIREQFDKAVALAPEAAVALYSLGSSDILDRATSEIVARLEQWELLQPDTKVLDIGCGIGRIERALAPHVGAITAIDVSPGMVEEARRRCRGLPNVRFEQCNGRDLAAFADRSFDLVLAIDSFPYLFAADPAIAAQHVRDAARLLRPGGALAILNFSYRGDDAADRCDVERLAFADGFRVRRAGSRDFTLWDGLTFLLVLPVHRE